MIKKALKFSPIFILSLVLTSCWGWTDERKQKVKNKCQEEMYDCDCYLKVTLDMFESPDDYNNPSDEKLAEYEERLNSECYKDDQEQNAATDGEETWKDEDLVKIYEEHCPENHDCDCFMNKAMEHFSSMTEFSEVKNNPEANKEKSDQFKAAVLSSCKL